MELLMMPQRKNIQNHETNKNTIGKTQLKIMHISTGRTATSKVLSIAAPDYEEMPLESLDAIKSLFEGNCRDGFRFLHRNTHSKKARKQCKVQEGSGHARQKVSPNSSSK